VKPFKPSLISPVRMASPHIDTEGSSGHWGLVVNVKSAAATKGASEAAIARVKLASIRSKSCAAREQPLLTLPRSPRGGLVCLLCAAFFVPLKTCSRNAELLAAFAFANDSAHVEDRLLSGGRSSPSALSPTHTRKSA
jgi:hypothetical protein